MGLPGLKVPTLPTQINCEVRGSDGAWRYGSKTEDQSVILADGTNLAQVASDDIRALTSMYIGTKIEALDDETKQWRAAVVISVVPNTGCAAPCSSTTVMVAFLDAGTATFTGVANLKPGNTLPCRCFSKIGCFDRDSCTCYVGNKDEDTFCVKTGDASLGGYCESCDANKKAHKKERFTQVNHDNRNCARCIEAFNECQCLDLEPLRQLKEVDLSAHRTALFEILAVSEANFQTFSKRSAARDAMKEKRLKFVDYFGAEAKLMLAEKGVPDWQVQQTYSLALTQFQKMNDLRNPTWPHDTNIPKNLVWYELAIDSLLYDMDPLDLLFDRAMRLRLHALPTKTRGLHLPSHGNLPDNPHQLIVELLERAERQGHAAAKAELAVYREKGHEEFFSETLTGIFFFKKKCQTEDAEMDESTDIDKLVAEGNVHTAEGGVNLTVMLGMMFASTEANTYYGNTSNVVFMSPQRRLVDAFCAGLHYTGDFPSVSASYRYLERAAWALEHAEGAEVIDYHLARLPHATFEGRTTPFPNYAEAAKQVPEFNVFTNVGANASCCSSPRITHAQYKPYLVGQRVRLHSLTSGAELNDHCGIATSFDFETERYIVDVISEEGCPQFKIKPSNLNPVEVQDPRRNERDLRLARMQWKKGAGNSECKECSPV
jgi:hypothetical protein